MIFSDEELQAPVNDSIQKVRPYLLKDGGDIKVLRIQNGRVYVELQGACKGCPSSTNTLKNRIQHQLRMDIHPDIEVIQEG
ncbi:hypothetical protein BBW65_00310 [Helicobacter enhydrae]|uniref:NIF system FeS cluster assembly NifU C-terminal domain-containing protein n=1 Tax=Helicobacter enhydrae TaxID=222136 RepID=A0A1B1U3L9_9HELI|nr:NifU family protein [Helicobacter enhydrae]ANV97356.1 hypothetical protein BBW65_00310 [Helicobacter enhydrae]